VECADLVEVAAARARRFALGVGERTREPHRFCARSIDRAQLRVGHLDFARPRDLATVAPLRARELCRVRGVLCCELASERVESRRELGLIAAERVDRLERATELVRLALQLHAQRSTWVALLALTHTSGHHHTALVFVCAL
jgi:hypothetical protein